MFQGIGREIPLIEGGKYNFTAKGDPEYMVSDHRVAGLGMPISKTPGERGDLIVRPSIKIPCHSAVQRLNAHDKSILVEVLQ